MNITKRLRTELRKSIPGFVESDVRILALKAERDRVEKNLRDEATRLASTQFPLHIVEPLLRAGQAYRTNTITVRGENQGSYTWSVRIVVKYPRVFPRNVVYGANARRNFVAVSEGHHIKVLYDRRAEFNQRLATEASSLRDDLADLILSARDTDDILQAWPAATAIVERYELGLATVQARLKSRSGDVLD